MSEYTSPSDIIALPEDWNINNSDLKLGSELGRGSFGSFFNIFNITNRFKLDS
jgi:hypothetical protein